MNKIHEHHSQKPICSRCGFLVVNIGILMDGVVHVIG